MAEEERDDSWALEDALKERDEQISPDMNTLLKRLHEELGLPVPETRDVGEWQAAVMAIVRNKAVGLSEKRHVPMSREIQVWSKSARREVKRLNDENRRLEREVKRLREDKVLLQQQLTQMEIDRIFSDQRPEEAEETYGQNEESPRVRLKSIEIDPAMAEGKRVQVVDALARALSRLDEAAS